MKKRYRLVFGKLFAYSIDAGLMYFFYREGFLANVFEGILEVLRCSSVELMAIGVFGLTSPNEGLIVGRQSRPLARPFQGV